MCYINCYNLLRLLGHIVRHCSEQAQQRLLVVRWNDPELTQKLSFSLGKPFSKCVLGGQNVRSVNAVRLQRTYIFEVESAYGGLQLVVLLSPATHSHQRPEISLR